jgi:hypothetical protein
VRQTGQVFSADLSILAVAVLVAGGGIEVARTIDAGLPNRAVAVLAASLHAERILAEETKLAVCIERALAGHTVEIDAVARFGVADCRRILVGAAIGVVQAAQQRLAAPSWVTELTSAAGVVARAPANARRLVAALERPALFVFGTGAVLLGIVAGARREHVDGDSRENYRPPHVLPSPFRM